MRADECRHPLKAISQLLLLACSLRIGFCSTDCSSSRRYRAHSLTGSIVRAAGQTHRSYTSKLHSFLRLVQTRSCHRRSGAELFGVVDLP